MNLLQHHTLQVVLSLVPFGHYRHLTLQEVLHASMFMFDHFKRTKSVCLQHMQ